MLIFFSSRPTSILEKKILLGQLGFIRFYQEEGKGKLGVILPETFNKFSQEINL